MSNKENTAPSPFVTSPRRPSEYWLKNPAWIDGAIDPPHFYRSHEEIEAAVRAAGASSGTYADQQAARLTPTPDHSTSSASKGQALGEVRNDTNKSDAGHLILVGMVYSLPAAPSGRGSKGPVKQKPLTKIGNIVLDAITRIEFIRVFLAMHNLSDKYSPGVNSGPDFKLWWSGSPGGKTGAATIQTDDDFRVALGHLLSKPKSKCQVSIEFDIDNMSGFRIQQPLPWTDPNTETTEGELVYGTKVPRVDGYSEATQLHGSIIIELKATWPCATHLNEHGGAGFCYVTNTSEHIRLNARRLKIWANAIAAHVATKHLPPNVIEFDGTRDGRLPGPRPRGRMGPSNTTPPTNQVGDMMQLMSGLLPLLGKLSRKRSRSESSSPVRRDPVTPVRQAHASPAPSPIPAADSELRACLSNFAEAKGIDLTACETALIALDLTPDIIPDVPVQRLCDITSATEGQIFKLHVFCRGWNARLEDKKEKRCRIGNM